MVCRSNGGVHRGEVRYRVPATLGMVQIGCVNIHVSVGFHLEMSLLKNPFLHVLSVVFRYFGPATCLWVHLVHMELCRTQPARWRVRASASGAMD